MTVVVAGSCNLDLIVEVARLPVPGQTVLGGDVITRPGGKGANQAVAAARMGAEVVFLGAVGYDHFGESLCNLLAANGLDLASVHRVDAPTGVALIVVDERGENVVTVAAGANRRLDKAHLDEMGTGLGADTVLLTQLEIPIATCLAAADRVRGVGGRVVVNAAPTPDPTDPELGELLERTDVVVANQTEAFALAGARPDAPGAGDWQALANQLRRRGPATVIVTLGADGAVVADGGAAYSVASLAVSAVDTTGAGDAFCGALAASLADGLPIRRAVHRACAAGALATTAVGAQEALPTWADLDALEAGRR